MDNDVNVTIAYSNDSIAYMFNIIAHEAMKCYSNS